MPKLINGSISCSVATKNKYNISDLRVEIETLDIVVSLFCHTWLADPQKNDDFHSPET